MAGGVFDPMRLSAEVVDAAVCELECSASMMTRRLGLPHKEGESAVMALIWLFGPLVIALGILGLVAAVPWLGWGKSGALLGYWLAGIWAGKFIIAIAVVAGEDPWFAALAVVVIDSLVGFFLAYNFDYAKRIPWIGPKLVRTEGKGRALLIARPFVRKAAFFGLVLFVMFPVTLTGAVGGTIVARIMGMPRERVLGAILLGSLLGSFAMAYLTGLMIWLFEDHKVLTSAVVLGIFALLASLYWYDQRRVVRALAAVKGSERRPGEG